MSKSRLGRLLQHKQHARPGGMLCMKPPAASTPVLKRLRYRSGSSAEMRRAISHLDFSHGFDLWAHFALPKHQLDAVCISAGEAVWEEGGSGGVRMTERWVSARPPTRRDTPQEPGHTHSTNSCSSKYLQRCSQERWARKAFDTPRKRKSINSTSFLVREVLD